MQFFHFSKRQHSQYSHYLNTHLHSIYKHEVLPILRWYIWHWSRINSNARATYCLHVFCLPNVAIVAAHWLLSFTTHGCSWFLCWKIIDIAICLTTLKFQMLISSYDSFWELEKEILLKIPHENWKIQKNAIQYIWWLLYDVRAQISSHAHFCHFKANPIVIALISLNKLKLAHKLHT